MGTWLAFFAACLAGIFVMYAPGLLFGRLFSLNRFESFAVAPAFSIIALTSTGAALYAAGITCPTWTLLALALVLEAGVFLIERALSGKRRPKKKSPQTGHNPTEVAIGAKTDEGRMLKFSALYICVATAFTLVVFVHAMGDPSSFSRNDDTTVHLSMVRGFLETGTYSVLHTSSYLDMGSAGTGFYPASWHVMAAIVAGMFASNVTLATNALLFAVIAVALPMSFLCLMKALFPAEEHVLRAGSLFTVAFCGFPWGFVVFGQLLPNLLSFSLIPMALGLLARALDAPSGMRAHYFAACLFCAFGVALAHPNGAFTLGIWAVLLCTSRFFFDPGSERASFNLKRIAGAVLFLALACATWAGCFLAPPLQGVVNYSTWSATLKPIEAIACGLLFMFNNREGVQPFLSVVVLLGVVCTCRGGHRRHLWLSAAYAFSFALYVVAVSTDGVAKHYLTGFWYCDYHRIGAMAALFAIPLAAVGFAELEKWLEAIITRFSKKHPDEHCTRNACTVTLVSLMLFSHFAPLHVDYHSTQVRTGMTEIHQQVASRYSWKNGLTSEEYAFVLDAMDITGNSLTMNVPRDGSCWSYGAEGANVFYRRCSSKCYSPFADLEELLRTRLCDYASSREVQEAVADTGIRYVLILDDASSDNPTVDPLRYSPEDWKGIESLNETTPGFTLVLSEGDMRLFRIG